MPKKWLRAMFRSLTLVILFVGLTIVISAGLFFWSLVRDLPEVAKLKEFRHAHATQVFSADGKKIGEFTQERRYPVRFEAIPKHVIQAFLAAEDSGFYQHKGIDYTSIMRAVVSNLLRGHYAQGGSTITQQVARALLLNSKKKEITRKIREMVLAWRMEKELSKNEILALYLSEIYLGHGAHGIGAAAQNYFGKKVEEITLPEATLLAGLPQRPNDWNPLRNPHLAKRRQQYVLNRMVEEKFIDAKASVEAFAEPLKLRVVEDINLKAAPYFTEFVRVYLMGKYGAERILTDGLRVETTLNLEYQKHAEKTMLAGLREVDKRLGWRGPLQRVEPAKTEAFLTELHEQVIGKVTPIRVLPAAFEENAQKRLLFDMTVFREQPERYYGPTPVEKGEIYKALVMSVDRAKNEIRAQVGQTPVTIPFKLAEWVKIEEKPIKNVAEFAKPGDVILVKVDTIERKSNQVTASLEQEPEIQGALLSFDHATGEVQAMVGGVDFEKNKFNCALQAKRQVGSTFKPIVYAAAMDKGFSPSSIVTDSPIVFKFEDKLDADNAGEDWRPHNYTGTFEGDIPLRLALIRSMNIPTIKLLNEITVDYAIDYARRLGITSLLPRDLSIGLGSWSSSVDEVTRAFAVFPRLGKPVTLYYIRKVVDAEGKVLEEMPVIGDSRPAATPPTVATAGASPAAAQAVAAATPADPNLAPGEVISPQTAYIMTDMLKGAVREGTGRPAFLAGTPVAGKTGTSNDHRDAWFIGFTPNVMTGIWIGYLKDKPLSPGETGGKAAAPIWAQYMERVTADYPKADFTPPDDIVFAYVDKNTGRLAGVSSPSRVRVAFKVGGVPDATGENLPRIGEPGSGRAAATTTDPHPVSHVPEETKKEAETDDFLRQGYQD